MTKKTDTSPQETFDHGQAQLLPTPLRPSELIKRLQLIFADERPHSEDPSIMLWGPPGVGKTSIVEQLVTQLQYTLFEWRLGSMTITVIGTGVSMPHTTEYSPVRGNCPKSTFHAAKALSRLRASGRKVNPPTVIPAASSSRTSVGWGEATRREPSR